MPRLEAQHPDPGGDEPFPGSSQDGEIAPILLSCNVTITALIYR
jgi:hypothetical protein